MLHYTLLPSRLYYTSLHTPPFMSVLLPILNSSPFHILQAASKKIEVKEGKGLSILEQAKLEAKMKHDEAVKARLAGLKMETKKKGK